MHKQGAVRLGARGDTCSLLVVLASIVNLEMSVTGEAVRLHECFEAGYDGFWLARFLINRGIWTTVLDSSGIPVSGQGRWAKTDRLNIDASASMLAAFCLGDELVCRPEHILTPISEDATQLTREREQQVKGRS